MKIKKQVTQLVAEVKENGADLGRRIAGFFGAHRVREGSYDVAQLEKPVSIEALDLASLTPKVVVDTEPKIDYIAQRLEHAKELFAKPSASDFAKLDHDPDVYTSVTKPAIKQLKKEYAKFAKDLLEPLKADILKRAPSLPWGDLPEHLATSYILACHSSDVAMHIDFPTFLAAHLYVRKDIPIWLAYLPQVRTGKIEPHWQAFHDLLNKSIVTIGGLAPTQQRQQFRAVHNTDIYADAKEGELVTFNQPSSSTQQWWFAKQFLHSDLKWVEKNPRTGEITHRWHKPNQEYRTKGDYFLQIWDSKDAVNIMSIWAQNDGDKAMSGYSDKELQDTEHLILAGTQCEVLLRAEIKDPKSKRKYIHIVMQDVRNHDLGHKERLLEALDLAKAEK